MKRLWVDIENGLVIETDSKHLKYIGHKDLEILELDHVKMDGKYYRLGEMYPLPAVPLVEMIPMSTKEFDDFDLQIQCEEVYTESDAF